jgi:hypothetical protein
LRRRFWFFDERYKEKQPSPQKSLLQHLFEARVELAEAALDSMDQPAFEAAAAPNTDHALKRSHGWRSIATAQAQDGRDDRVGDRAIR